MTSLKSVVLTAINFKGTDQVKNEAQNLADSLMCSKSYVLSIVRKVEKKEIIIKK